MSRFIVHKGPTLTSLLSALLFTVVTIPSAHAFRVQPMVTQMDALGSNSRTTMRIENNDSVPLTIEVVPHRLSLAADGTETLTSADEDLFVFPPVAVVPPGSSQILQIQYVGDPEITASQAYRVAIDQVPVELSSASGSTVGVVASIHTLLNVVPVNSQPVLAVTGIESEGDRWRLVIANSGTRYARFSETAWTITAGGQSVEVGVQELQQRMNRNLILPNSTLEVTFIPPDGLSDLGAEIAISPR